MSIVAAAAAAVVHNGNSKMLPTNLLAKKL